MLCDYQLTSFTLNQLTTNSLVPPPQENKPRKLAPLPPLKGKKCGLFHYLLALSHLLVEFIFLN
jgi:hypothetical protein